MGKTRTAYRQYKMHLEETYFDACADGDLPGVRELLSRGYSSNRTGHWRGTPLTISARGGHHEVVSYLIASGAKVDNKDHSNRTALHHSSERGHLKVVEALLNAGAKTDEVDTDHSTPLMLAAGEGHHNVVTLLIASGANVDRADKQDRTALDIASMRGHLKIIESLVNVGGKSVQANSEALMFAAKEGHHSIVKHLIASGAHVNTKGEYNRTPLHNASIGGHLNVVNILLNAGANVDEIDEDHSTALMLAAHKGHHSIVSQLIANGANVDKKNGVGRTPLLVASEERHLEVIEKLLSAGAKVNEPDEIYNSTPLLCAVFNRYTKVTYLLLDYDADVTKQDDSGRTALHFAAETGQLEVVDILLNKGAKVNIADKHHRTPLVLSALKNHYDVMLHLITSGADVAQLTKHTSFGTEILSYAINRKRIGVIKILIANGIGIEGLLSTSPPMTALMWTAQEGYNSLTKELILQGVNVNCENPYGHTALHFASYYAGLLETVKILLNNGADVDLKDKQDYNPLVLSAVKKNFEIMLLLIASGADVAQLAKHSHSGRDLSREALSYVITYKHTEVANILITKGIGIKGFLSTSPPMTSLMWTAQEGYDSLTKHLILQGANVNYQNPYGHTALHFAAYRNNIQCAVLLVEAGADVSIVNKASQTPLDLSSNEFKDAILQTLSFQTKKTVCVIGNAMSGKSTLIASLQNENAGFVKKIRNWLLGVQDISERTAGIEPVSLSSKRYGDVMFFDFAGQQEYHGPHEMFLESILSKGLSTMTIIVVVKATEEESAICHQLNRWLHPFSKMSSSANPVRVIAIGSYMDKVTRKVEAKEKLELCYRRVKDSLRGVPLKFGDLCYLDCRQPYSSDISKLCKYLRDVPPPQYKARDTAYSICWVISRMRSSFEDKVISVSEFSDWIAHNKANLPTNLPPAEEVCKDLSSTGHFLYLPSKEGTSNGWLVLDLPSILHELYGTLFSPFEGCRSRIVDKFGLLSIQKLKEIFPSLNLEMICNVLVSLEFCIEVESSTLKKLKVSVSEGVQESPEHLFFPALVSSQCPKSFEHTSPSPHTLCWQLVAVEGEYFISPRLLQTIILRLAADHVFRHQRGSITQEYDCSVWQNGIFWQSTKDVDVAVQITDNAVVQVIGSCGFDPKAATTYDPDILFRYISTIIQDIIGTICDLSPHLSGGTYMIHPVNPQALLENPRSPSPQEMFPVDFILESRRNNATTCRPLEGIRKAISDVFGGFEPSVDVTARLLMPQCKCIFVHV